mgnify:FL=1
MTARNCWRRLEVGWSTTCLLHRLSALNMDLRASFSTLLLPMPPPSPSSVCWFLPARVWWEGFSQGFLWKHHVPCVWWCHDLNLKHTPGFSLIPMKMPLSFFPFTIVIHSSSTTLIFVKSFGDSSDLQLETSPFPCLLGQRAIQPGRPLWNLACRPPCLSLSASTPTRSKKKQTQKVSRVRL